MRGSNSREDIEREHSSRAGQPFDDSELLRQRKRTCFDYELPDKTLLYQVCRYDFCEQFAQAGVDMPKKRFLVRRPIDTFDRQNNIGLCVFGAGNRRVIYNWPAIMCAGPGATVYTTEGEGKADALNKLGLLATSVLGHNWTPECVAALTGRHLIILVDNDERGRKLAADAYAALASVAASIRIVTCEHLWPHLPQPREPGPSADINDWLDYGGDASKLLDICRSVPAEGEIAASAYEFPEERTIARYDWLYGKHLIRGEVSGTAAAGGTGKSNLSIIEALEMASGKQLLHDRVPKPLRVVLINLEDKRNTMDKRIAAVMRHYNLTKTDIGDRLIVLARGEIKIKIAQPRRTGGIERNELTIRALIKLMKEKRGDVLSIDSFIRTHSVSENDNSTIQDVVECFEDIAIEANCAIHLWHHTRKMSGEKATVESARGAGAFVDSCRSARILETMSRKDCDELKKIMPDVGEPGWYFRSFNGKRNLAPPADQSDWFKYVSIELDNGSDDDLFREGDNVGVVTRWIYPQIDLPTLTAVDVSRICGKLREGGPWRADSRSTVEPWVGIPIAQAAGLNLLDPRVKKRVAKLVKEWLAAGRLRVVRRPDRHGDEREYMEAPAVE